LLLALVLLLLVLVSCRLGEIIEGDRCRNAAEWAVYAGKASASCEGIGERRGGKARRRHGSTVADRAVRLAAGGAGGSGRLALSRGGCSRNGSDWRRRSSERCTNWSRCSKSQATAPGPCSGRAVRWRLIRCVRRAITL